MKQKSHPSFQVFMQDCIKQLRQSGKLRTAETYSATLKSFTLFYGTKPLAWAKIDDTIMLSYEGYLRQRGVSKNSSSFYMRILRAVYNRGVEQGLTTKPHPFRHVYTGIDKTTKRAISLREIKLLLRLDLSRKPSYALARDLFLFSFYTRGMSFVDMAYLKKKNLAHGILSYRRQKTGQLLAIRWEPCMQQIIDRHPAHDTDFLLPIITSSCAATARKEYLNTLLLVNRKLKEIGKKAHISIPLTTYVARHSWATAAYCKNIPLSVISEAMGHDSEQTTQIYLSSLNSEEIDKANSLIIKSL